MRLELEREPETEFVGPVAVGACDRAEVSVAFKGGIGRI